MKCRLSSLLFFILVVACVQCASAKSYDIVLGGLNTKTQIWYNKVKVKDYGEYYEYDFGNNVDVVGWQIYIPELKDHDVTVYITVEKSGNGVVDLLYNQKEVSALSIIPLKIGNLITLPNAKISYGFDFKKGKPYVVFALVSEGYPKGASAIVKLYKTVHVYVHEEEQPSPTPKPTPISTPKPQISVKITDVIGYVILGSALAIGVLIGLRRW